MEGVGVGIEKERYRKISLRMWPDDKFRSLSRPQPNGQSLWVFLLTGPFTVAIPGFVVGGPAAMAEELGWDTEGFLEAFGEVSGKGMAKADWKARLVWVPKGIRHNPPESPNVIRSWRKAWPLIPECNLKWTAYRELKGFIEGMGEGFHEAFGEALWEGYPHPSPNQEQEQEQEKYLEERSLPSDEGGGERRSSRTVQRRSDSHEERGAG